MTMHIYFNQDKDGYKKDWSGYVERSLARRFCENGIAIPYQNHVDNVYESEQAKKKELLKKKKPIVKKTVSKKNTKAEKAVNQVNDGFC